MIKPADARRPDDADSAGAAHAGPDSSGQDASPRPYWDTFSGSRTRLDTPPPWADLPPQTRQGIRIDTVRRAFRHRYTPPPAPQRPGIRDAAVLLVLFEEADEARVVLTERSGTVSTHRGEIAFPGGVCDAGETSGQAALREAWEEIGLAGATVELIGELGWQNAELTKFQITPMVGTVAARPLLRINHSEVRDVFDVALTGLMADGVYREELWVAPDGRFMVPFFDLPQGIAWGVTASILVELLAIVTGGVHDNRPPPPGWIAP
ncbi:CoA pyrophosphatase [Frankia sp. Cas3]|uniref:NUDIX hydrolase n=1 Tax=Frankia sp. Cas3 TaxID=3073926 RepID=UPI002AD2C196|nr:CoA pyrophosphatase [Frankia sp. Cas3]